MTLYKFMQFLMFMLAGLTAGLGFAFFAPFAVVAILLMSMSVSIWGLLKSLRSSLEASEFFNRVGGSLNFRDRDEISEVDERAQRRDWLSAIVSQTLNSGEGVRALAMQDVNDILNFEIDSLTALLPSDTIIKHEFRLDSKEIWNFELDGASSTVHFHALGTGVSPRGAFENARQELEEQIQAWRQSRNSENVIEFPESRRRSPNQVRLPRAPTVLIVEDDLDVANGAATVFQHLGCNTVIADGGRGTTAKLLLGHVDFVILDWNLAKNVKASRLLRRATRLIRLFAEFRQFYQRSAAKVVTFSVSDRASVDVPRSKYFAHLDHWQKPLRYGEMMSRAEELLRVNGFAQAGGDHDT